MRSHPSAARDSRHGGLTRRCPLVAGDARVSRDDGPSERRVRVHVALANFAIRLGPYILRSRLPRCWEAGVGTVWGWSYDPRGLGESIRRVAELLCLCVRARRRRTSSLFRETRALCVSSAASQWASVRYTRWVRDEGQETARGQINLAYVQIRKRRPPSGGEVTPAAVFETKINEIERIARSASTSTSRARSSRPRVSVAGGKAWREWMSRDRRDGSRGGARGTQASSPRRRSGRILSSADGEASS